MALTSSTDRRVSAAVPASRRKKTGYSTGNYLSLAALEQLVRFRAEEASRAWFYYEVDIHDAELQSLGPLDRLPANWRTSPAPASLADLAARWFESQASVGLIVPSAVIPEESNVVLNPEHPRFRDLLPDPVPNRQEFRFDERLIEVFAIPAADVVPPVSRPKRPRKPAANDSLIRSRSKNFGGTY